MSTEQAESLTQRLKHRWFDDDDHPYVHFERKVREVLRPDHVLVEPGCGRFAEVLRRFQGEARELIGIDPVELEEEAHADGLRIRQGSIAETGLEAASVDTMISRALMEHLPEPEPVFDEIARVLRPGGRYVFLAPNLGDYSAVVAKLVPNSWHPSIVSKLEGRDVKDTFPAYFRCNTRRSVRRLSRRSGLVVEHFEYLGQYPSYFLFNPVLFTLASGYEKLISSCSALGFLRGWMLVVLRRPEA